MQKNRKNELKTYKKARLLFQWFEAISLLGLFVYFLIMVLINSTFNTNCVIALSVFCVCALIMVVFNLVFNKQRYRLVEKHFGKVSVEDIEKSKVLLSQINMALSGEYSFLAEGQFEFNCEILAKCLKEISKGHKVNIQLVEIFFDIQNEIEKSTEKDLAVNRDFNLYINELANLFDRNKSEI